ncbi:unnamed protein product [Durusdinium trenchii]|uniref:Calmodulin-lysine N-methyltransferase n=1 Tax=Durusdinium trenchii TaxID=1381693 RepID=A0ABP0KX58_9DINO
MEDPIRCLPTLSEPRQLRLEDACRWHQAQTAQHVAKHLGERTADMVADGEARSQRRYNTWAMSSLVPEEAQHWKAKVLPFFDELASTCASSRRSPHWTAESFFDAQASRSSQTWKSASSAEKSPKSAGPKRVAASTKAPSTPEEVGHWLSSHDALQSVKGDPLKSSCGWSSGFRRDPMSTEEVLQVRIMERSNAAFAKRRKDERSSWAVRFAVLMAHLASSRGRALLHGKDVLELGAGNGALAKAVAVNAQPRKLVATDLPHRVEELQNVLHGTGVRAAALHWGDAAAVAQLCREHFGRPHAQVVLISDCLYTNWVEDSAHLLAKTLHAALASESIALLAYLPRSGPLEAHFFECVQHVYGLQTLPKPLPDYYLLKAMDEAREFQEEELRAVRLFEISAVRLHSCIPGVK